MMKSVIILAGTTMGSVLSLCKSAHKLGAEVYLISFNEKFAKLYKASKFVNEVYYVQSSVLLTFCKQLVLEKNFLIKPILYSTTDQQCLLISQNRGEFEKIFDLCLPSDEIVKGYNKKGDAERLAERQGILIPKSKLITCLKDTADILKIFSFPIVVKPISSNVKVGYKFKILDKESFEYMFHDETMCNGTVLCQEYIPGEDEAHKFYIFYRDENGDILECMGNKTMQTNGIMTIGTTEKDITLSTICKHFLKSIDYVGVGGLEFKKYENAYYFIEMSTRPEGFLPIADMAGVSLSEASYKCMNNLTVDFNIKQKENIQYFVLLTILVERLKKYKFLSMFKSIFICFLSKNIYCVELFIDYRSYLKSVKSYRFR
ncbi:hypothetical protein ACT3CE_05930 [Marinifilum sp. RC60d5]|uniref:hypothetical protein n=1 Tax=Marinifilum sp. RC60d5 TaxID=3458414 RepID=UPI004035AB71